MPTPALVMAAIERVLRPLLDTLERIVWVQRYLYPPVAARLAEVLEPQTEALAPPLSALESEAWPDATVFMRERLLDVGRQTLDILAAFSRAAGSPRHARPSHSRHWFPSHSRDIARPRHA